MFDVLLEAALRATLIAAAALVVLWLMRVRAAAVQHRLWTVVVIAMLALPLWIVWAPEITLRVLPSTYSGASGALAAPLIVDAPLRDPAGDRAARTGAAELAPASSAVEAWSWRDWVLVVYLLGAAFFLARLAIGTVRVRSLMREAVVVNGRLTCTGIATPITVGLLRPKILLPEGWDRWPAARLAAVVDHERGHASRYDPLVQWFALLNRALFWFHPLAWWLERHLAALAEEACDAAVLARGHDRADYAEHLLAIARLAIARRSGCRPRPHMVGMPMPGSALATRITKLLEGRVAPAGSRTAAAGAGVLATLAAAVLGTVTLAQEQTPPRSLLDAYELALGNDPVVRQAEAAYRALAGTPPGAESSLPDTAVTRALTDYEAARQALLIRVAEAYLGVLAAEATLAFSEGERDVVGRLLEQTERRFEVGLIPITAVQETRAGVDEAVANVVAAEGALGTAREALSEIVGVHVGELSPLRENLPLIPPDPEHADEWVVISAFARAQALRQAVRSNQTALETTRRGFEVGLRTTTDVLAEQNRLHQAETAYVLGRHDHILNMLRLQQTAGGLTGDLLAQVESWFE